MSNWPIYVWWGTQVLKGCGRVTTTRAFAPDTGFLTCNDMPKGERSAAQARAEAVYRLANPDDRGDRGRDRRAEKVEYRRRLKNARAEAAALAVLLRRSCGSRSRPDSVYRPSPTGPRPARQGQPARREAAKLGTFAAPRRSSTYICSSPRRSDPVFGADCGPVRRPRPARYQVSE